MVPQKVHLHGQMLGKTHHECPSTWWPRGDPIGMIFFTFFQFPRKCLIRHSFLLDITVPTAFVLQHHKWSKIFRLENHLSLFFFYHTTCQQHWMTCVPSWLDVRRYICPGCRCSHFLPHNIQTSLFHIYGAFLWYKHERIYTLEMGIVPRR